MDPGPESFEELAPDVLGECVEEGGSVPVVPDAPECCEGLVKVPCDKPDAEGHCQPCAGASMCTYCGDGECGTGENVCNRPSDCAGECLGDPYGSDPAGTLKVEVTGHDITLHHEAVVLNCCFETTVCFTPKADSIEVVEHNSGGAPCFCMCLFDIVATLPGIRSGTYELSLYNEEQGQVLFQQTVEVP